MKLRKLKRMRYNVSEKIRKEYFWITKMRSFILSIGLQDKPPSNSFSFYVTLTEPQKIIK